jgi:Fic family protein
MSEDRHSLADPVELITDPDQKAKREAENGVRQFKTAMEVVKKHVLQPDNPFRLTQALILDLHEKALEGIHPLAGTYRNTIVNIGNSSHLPPRHAEVPDFVAEMCKYVNDNWGERCPIHLSAYVLWRMNWIHPFADGNGRTARILFPDLPRSRI